MNTFRNKQFKNELILVNFGAILTAKIYSQSLKEIQLKRIFCRESISNPYCVF